MDNEIWKYKVGGGLQWLLPVFILLAVFGGVTIWLYTTNNGAFIFLLFLTIIVLAIMVCSIYRTLFVKVLIGEKGFYHQTKPGNGHYYAYADITEAWESSGKSMNASTAYYCSCKTLEGQVVKFPFFSYESDGIDYLLLCVNGETYEADGEDTDEF